MKKTRDFTILIEKESTGYSSICPELDVASQGESINEAKINLIEAMELFLESAANSEISERLQSEVHVLQVKLDY